MFAAYKQSAQRRKSAAVEPHIKHLIEVAQLISAANFGCQYANSWPCAL
jgi:hypothetical protein